MTPDPLTFAHRWQRCGCAESPEAERGPNPQCVALAALIEARGREIRAAELALREAEAAEEYAAAHPLLAKPVLAEGVAE